MINIGVVGGTGYTGAELLRLLSGHPDINIHIVTSRTEAGRSVDEVFPGLRGRLDLQFASFEDRRLWDCDLVFFATPNGTAMQHVPKLLEKGIRVIDLAADFRLQNEEVFRQWYGIAHACPELLKTAVYGLPEVNRETISKASLVANPGCYPTAIQLGLLPLIESGRVTNSVIVDAKSGVSGAGRGANVNNLLCEVSESFKAYGVDGHRHTPEIHQGLKQMQLSGQAAIDMDLTFVPHLVPMVRGIHATIYCSLKDRNIDVQALFENRFRNEPFVDVMPVGSHPETRSVKASNQCRIAVHHIKGSDRVIVLAVIDNLVKGAAGQAIQNMNIMFGLDETCALNGIALMV